MDYSIFLPDINVMDGKTRVMGNMKLYLRLVGRFDGFKMAGSISDAVKAGDIEAAADAAHALRGTAANLAFPVVQEITEKIENSAKEGEDCTQFLQPLEDAVTALADVISRIVSMHQE